LPSSMTGFAASEITVESFRLVWEIRSVNHRYLDLGFRLPDELKSLEPMLRQRAGEILNRGKIESSLKLTRVGSAAGQTEVDPERLEALMRLAARVQAEYPEAGALSVSDILRWPGLLKVEEQSGEALLEPALRSFSDALEQLSAARMREGSRLVGLLHERLDAISALMSGVDELLVQSAPRYRDKLLERLTRLDVEVNPERLEQELALIAQRVDVSEEADRLRAHLSEIRDVLQQTEPVGRRLDFLIQELNREANTLASKVQDEELGRRAVDIKVLIEQMREQVQNIE